MNMPEDPTSIPSPGGRRPIPPVEDAWSQMERKLDANLPVPRPPASTRALKAIPRIGFGSFRGWAAAGAAAITVAVVALLVFKEVATKPSANAHASPNTEASPHAAPSANTRESANSRSSSGPNASANTTTASTHNKPGGSRTHQPGNSRLRRTNDPLTETETETRTGEDNSTAGVNIVDKNTTNKSTTNKNINNKSTTNKNNSNNNKSTTTQSDIATHKLTSPQKAGVTPALTVPLRKPDSLLLAAAAKHAKGINGLKGPGQPNAVAFRKFSLGFTLRQYLPMPGQNFNDYNTDGGRYVYSDYVPAVFLRAAITETSYIQAEYGFHSPQYTRNIEAEETLQGASTVPGYAAYLAYEKTTLKKLFYNEVDLTYHHRFGDRWWLGAGVQYAILAGGAMQDQLILKPANAAAKDTIYSTTVLGMRNHTGYYDVAREKKEWRGIIDVEYAWDRWMLGLRYQQAVETFYFYLVASPGYTTNSAVSIRASYTLWRSRH